MAFPNSRQATIREAMTFGAHALASLQCPPCTHWCSLYFILKRTPLLLLLRLLLVGQRGRCWRGSGGGILHNDCITNSRCCRR